jgi:hypothetical protein
MMRFRPIEFLAAVALVGLCAVPGYAQKNESIALVLRENDGEKAVSKDLLKQIQKSLRQALLKKSFAKVVQGKASLHNCRDSACFRKAAKKLRVSRIVVIQTETIRKGIFGMGSKCSLSYELRNSLGSLINQQKTMAPCKAKKIQTAFLKMAASLKPRQQVSATTKAVGKSMTECGKSTQDAQQKLNLSILKKSGLASSQGQLPFNQLKTSKNKNQEVCLTQNLEDLRANIRPMMVAVNACAAALPKTRAARVQATKQCLSKVSQTELLIDALKNRLTGEELSNLDVLSRLRSKLMSARERVTREFKACAKTKNEALEALSHNISSQVSDRFDSVASVGSTGEELKILETTTIQSHVQLQNIRWDNEGEDGFCAVQHYDDLMNATLARLDRVSTCEERFPDDPQLKHRLVSACLSDIRFVSELYPLFWADMSAPQRSVAGKLTTLAARLEDLGGKILLQTIEVDVLAENASLFIDGIPQKASTALPWPSGEIHVEIKGPNLCPFQKKVPLAERQRLVLKPDLSHYAFPRILFGLQQKNARLWVDGHSAVANQSMTFSQCSGSITYKVMLPDGETETDQVELSAGMNETVRISILTKKERKRLRQFSHSFESSKLLIGTYRLSYPLSDKLDAPFALQAFSVEYTEASHALRYGGGAAYGFGANDSHMFEAYGQLTAQLTSLGGSPLNLTNAIALIPFLSVDLGFGYHGLLTKTSQNRGDFGDFLSSYIIARGHAGLMFAPSEELAVKLHFSHNLTMERPLSINAGIAVKLP